MNRSVQILSAACLITFMGAWLAAGPLDPPAGPVAPTHKTLTEVEPRIAINSLNTPGDANSSFRIDKPGSYYLTGNVQGVASRHGIEVFADGVTIDLGGFQMLGVTNSLDAVNCTGGFDRLRVHGGTIKGWGGSGIALGLASSSGCTFSDLRIASCGGSGLQSGADAVVSDCTVLFNGASGLVLGASSVATRCVSGSNEGHGFEFASDCVLSECTGRLNALDGFHTATASTGGDLITDCSVFANTGDGIEIGIASTVRDCQIVTAGLDTGNGAGIHVIGSQCRIEGNNIIQCDRGIDVDGTGNIIVRNTCSGNTTDFSIVAGNTLGGIIAAGTNGGLINGSSAPGTIGTTDPWSNVSY